jgi:sugar phosphate permease
MVYSYKDKGVPDRIATLTSTTFIQGLLGPGLCLLIQLLFPLGQLGQVSARWGIVALDGIPLIDVLEVLPPFLAFAAVIGQRMILPGYSALLVTVGCKKQRQPDQDKNHRPPGLEYIHQIDVEQPQIAQ